LILQGPTGCGKNAMIKAYCAERGLKLERFQDTKMLVDYDDQVKTVGARNYPQDLQNLIEFVRKNCTEDGTEAKIVRKAAPNFSSFCTKI
jgi:hypothetical protein